MVELSPETRPEATPRAAGFTILEVCVAMAMLAFGLLAVSAAQLYAMRGASSGRHSSDAAEFVQRQVEEFQHYAWNDTTTDARLGSTAGAWVTPAGVVTDTQVNSADGQVVEQQYTVQYRVTDTVNAGGQVFLKTIDVRAQWDEPNRPGRSYTISTMRHKDSES